MGKAISLLRPPQPPREDESEMMELRKRPRPPRVVRLVPAAPAAEEAGAEAGGGDEATRADEEGDEAPGGGHWVPRRGAPSRDVRPPATAAADVDARPLPPSDLELELIRSLSSLFYPLVMMRVPAEGIGSY
ncbi:unnamed protein product [Urochloa humidicola]